MITSKQRAFLRGLANKIDATIQVGKGGINDNMTELVNSALEKNELVKIHVLENSFEDTRDVCHKMSELTGAEEVQVIGSKFVLYKPSVENKKIDLKTLTVKEPKKEKKSVKPLYKAKEAAQKERKRIEEEKERKRKFILKTRYKRNFK